jgi:hypothetical protein
LVRQFYNERDKPPTPDALRAVLDVLEAQAEFDGSTLPVFIRVAGVDDASDPDNPT